MKPLLTAAAVVAALVLIGVSATLNYLFMASLARSPAEAVIMGSAAVAGDLIKCCLPAFMALAIKAKKRMFVVIAAPVFALLTMISLIAALGFAADMRGGTAHGRDSLSKHLLAAEAEHARTSSRRGALTAARPSGQIEAELAQLKLDRRWIATKDCADVTLPVSRTFCADLRRLQSEHAAAVAMTQSDADLTRLDTEIARLRADGAGQETEPQVRLLSLLTGQDSGIVRSLLSVLSALFIEISSGFGLYLALQHSVPPTKPATRAKDPDSDPDILPPPPLRVGAGVESYALARLVARRGGVLAMDTLYADYVAWRSAHKLMPVTADVFATAFGRLAVDVGIGRAWDGYVGIAFRPDLDEPTTHDPARAMLGAS